MPIKQALPGLGFHLLHQNSSEEGSDQASGVRQGVFQAMGLGPQALLAAGWWQTPPAPGVGLSEFPCAVSYVFMVNST